MRKFAFLRENVVVKIELLDEEFYSDAAKDYQLVIDVEDFIVTPAAGWILDNNRLIPSQGQAIPLKQIIIGKLTRYQEIAPSLLKELYADNTLMGITPAQSDAMFDEYSDVVLRLSQGAFPTAIYRLQHKEPSGFVTQELIDNWIAKIQACL